MPFWLLVNGLRQRAIDSSVVAGLLLFGHRIIFLLPARMPASPAFVPPSTIVNFRSAVLGYGNFVP